MAEIAVAAALGVANTVLELFLVRGRPDGELDVRHIKEQLLTMRAYLRDTANDGEEATEGSRDRRNKVRDIAYEIEDALERFMLDVPEHYHEHKFSIAAHDIVHLVKDWRSFRRLSSCIKDIQVKIKNIKDLDSFRQPTSVASSSSAGVVHDLPYPTLSNDELVGMEKRRDELLRLLINEESRRRVISVVGASGSGKTTLLKYVLDSERVKGHFDCYAWVPHSLSCEDTLEKISKQIIDLSVTQRSEVEWNHCQGRRYLVVLDGIWKDDVCNSIISKLPDCGNGSRIIISTCMLDLAYGSSHQNYNLNGLAMEEARELFCKKAFRGSRCPKHLQEISDLILSRCDGLPLAVVAVGSLLSTVPRTPAAFQKVNDSLKFSIENNFKLEIIRKVMQQRYFHLPHDLKCCFLYMCNFPEDYPVTRGRLTRLWVAEGFAEKKSDKTAEEVADAYLDELINGCLVDANKRDFQGLVRSCRVSNPVRECLVSLSEYERFCKVLTKPISISDQDMPRRLAIHDVFTDTLLQQEDGLFSHVRTLCLFGREGFSNPKFGKLLGCFNFLRVLELKDAPLETFPTEVINLTLLRYLNLRNTKIKAVPGSVKKLQNLITLDLRQTFVSKLPKDIRKLRKLVHLLVDRRDAGQPRVGTDLSLGIGALTSLQKLTLIKANKNRGVTKELGNLTAMRKLAITQLESTDGKDLCKSIQRMEHLSCLHVTSISEEVLDLDHLRTPPTPLHRLSLEGKLQATPSWISSLNSLVKVSLKSSRLDNTLFEALHPLPSLMELQLVDAFTGKQLEFERGWFQELRMLELEQSDELHTVLVCEGAMPKLQKLTMRRCKNLKMVPWGINHLTKLEEMHLYEMSEELINGLQALRIGEDHWMLDHIPVIHTSCSTVNSTRQCFQNLSSFAKNST